MATSIPDALQIVECNHPGFLHRVRRGQFHCLHGEHPDNATEMEEHQALLPRSQGDFHLIPVAEGAKGRGFKTIFTIVVGGALLATGIGGALGAFGSGFVGLSSTAATGIGFLGLSYGSLALMGGALLLGGINQLLTPTPKVNTADRSPTSFTFGGPASVSDEGGPIPLVYGEVITSGITISSDLRTGYGQTTGNNPYGSGEYGGVGQYGGLVTFGGFLTDGGTLTRSYVNVV